MISVIIPAYNCEKTIETTLDSVLKQNYDDYEIIVIDDGSKDQTLAVLRNYKEKKYSDLRLFTQKNAGPGSARNRGIIESKGEYIVFVDSDDVLLDTYLQTLLNGIQQDQAIDFCFASYYRQDDSNPPYIIANQLSGVNGAEDTFVSFICNKTHISLWNSIYKGSIIRNYGLRFIDNCYSGEDVEFISRYLMRCNLVFSENTPIYNFYFDSKRSANRNNKNTIKKVTDSVYWPLLDSLQNLNWEKGYNALRYGKFPVTSILEIINVARMCDTYDSFYNTYKNECKDLMKSAKSLRFNLMSNKVSIKSFAMCLLAQYFNRLFYVVVRKMK